MAMLMTISVWEPLAIARPMAASKSCGRLRGSKSYPLSAGMKKSPTSQGQGGDFPKEEVERRARELAQRVMSKPPQPQAWPKKPKATKSRADAAKPSKRARAAEAS